MKKLILFLVVFLLVFGSLSVAQEPEERIEESINKLGQVQGFLEEGDRGEAASVLADVKSEIIQARFQLLATESERTLVGSQWVIEFPEELRLETYHVASLDEYYISVKDVIAKNQADEKRVNPDWDVYLLDPKGIQRKVISRKHTGVLPGQAVYIKWAVEMKISEFVPGTYTLLFKPEFESEPEELRFNIELSKEDFDK